MKFLALSSPQVANVSTRFARARQMPRRATVAPRHVLLGLGAAFCLTSSIAPSVQAAPRKRATAKATSKARVTKTKAPAAKIAPAKPIASKPLPQYLPLDQINMLRAARANLGWGALQPLMNGRQMDDNMAQLPGAATMIPGLPTLIGQSQSGAGKCAAVPDCSGECAARRAHCAQMGALSAGISARWNRHRFARR